MHLQMIGGRADMKSKVVFMLDSRMDQNLSSCYIQGCSGLCACTIYGITTAGLKDSMQSTKLLAYERGQKGTM